MNNITWMRIRQLGYANGWMPRGTTDPALCPDSRSRWSGGYSSNDGQWVEDDDAITLAAALERAKTPSPETGHPQEDPETMVTTTAAELMQCLERLLVSNILPENIDEVITFLRRGGFRIF